MYDMSDERSSYPVSEEEKDVTQSSANVVAYAPLVFLAAYTLVGGLALRLWFGRYRRSRIRPRSFNADPEAYLSYWLPQVVVAEVFTLVGSVIMCLLLLFVTGLAHRADALYTWIGFGSAIGFWILFSAGVNVALVARVHALRRRERVLSEAAGNSLSKE
jgi:hypothetical protein